MSNIEPLPGKHWSVKAALVDMLDKTNEVQDFMMLWTDKDGQQHCQSAQLCNRDAIYMLTLEIHKMMEAD